MNASMKVMIVEGISDKRKLSRIISEPITIVCTNGTLGIERFDELLEKYKLDDKEVYIFVDEDSPGKQLRRQLAHELPHGVHLYTELEYKEVAETPDHMLATILAEKHIRVYSIYLMDDR
ncbi:toprim domain-containing protein [Virgibacillus sp. W0430]|uniref:toprim domain-containing protein n=1 Tax=Virgibacillus sp. W0430 TaxID=3391580 RepID=UPI003F47F583